MMVTERTCRMSSSGMGEDSGMREKQMATDPVTPIESAHDAHTYFTMEAKRYFKMSQN